MALSLFSDPPRWQRILLTLVWAWLAARTFEALHTPIPWMIGPLVSVSLVSMLGFLAPLGAARGMLSTASHGTAGAMRLSVAAKPGCVL